MRAVLAALIACAMLYGCNRYTAGADAGITGVTWRLVELEGRRAQPGAQGDLPTLRFDDENRASGNAGCNSFGGTYTRDDNALRFGALAMTRMACPGHMDQETAFASALEATRSYRISDGSLELIDGGAVVARFER